MRDYLYEIEKVNMEIGEIKMLIEDYEMKRYKLDREKGMLIFYPEYALQQVFNPVIREQKLIESKELRRTYEMYTQRIDELDDELRGKHLKISRLRGAFKRTHTRDFYRPMDEIDICDLIGKDGYIIGVKF